MWACLRAGRPQPRWAVRDLVLPRGTKCTAIVRGVHHDFFGEREKSVGREISEPIGAKKSKSESIENFKHSYAIAPTVDIWSRSAENVLGEQHTVVGFLHALNVVSGSMLFGKIIGSCSAVLEERSPLQFVLRSGKSAQDKQIFDHVKSTTLGSAIAITGTFQRKHTREATSKACEGQTQPVLPLEGVELRIDDFKCIQPIPKELAPGANTIYTEEDRHLKIRFDAQQQWRLGVRSALMQSARNHLSTFLEVETPLLFRSTREGAREYIVPTRAPGYAYALPQSPQQYKQILMAAGVGNYYQFARCFRDEDFRADRQPEFTQLDMEMAWSDGLAVRSRVTDLVRSLFQRRNELPLCPTKYGDRIPFPPLPNGTDFHELTYAEAMKRFGSDKPDLRINGEIHQVQDIIPDNLQRMLTSIEEPAIDVWKFSTTGKSAPKTMRDFVSKLMSSADFAPYRENVHGAPGIFVVDASKPQRGLAAFGFESIDKLEQLYDRTNESGVAEINEISLEDGDVVFLQARPPGILQGASTSIGQLRRAVWKQAVQEGLVEQSSVPRLLWITDFPLFTVVKDADTPGGRGISSTHHPFTAPKTAEDVDLMLTDPLSATADHYDLVYNGIEIGGGSKRIHDAVLQEYVFTDILKLPNARIDDFAHLLRALRSGCPPHAGFALGWDRLMAMMMDRESIRDVIAFPKNKNAQDVMVKSPSLMTAEQMATYHLSVNDITKA